MKKNKSSYCIFLVLFASLFANAQNFSAGLDEKKAGMLLEKVRTQQATEDEKKALQEMALAAQNSGQWFDERNHDYKKSMQNIDHAIVFYTALGDTLNLAFNKKYKGHLLVRLGKLPAAKNEIQAAVYLYQLSNTGAGVAAAQFELARIFEYENKADSAVYYAGLSRAYWQLQENNLQLVVINNMLVYHLLQLNQTEKAQSVYQASQLLLKKQAVHWQPLLDFYFTAMLLYRQINDMSGANRYRDLYYNKKAELQAQGITARSYYERDGQ
ncbi:MAG: hypothetical protein ABIQ88_21480 [Chitinophagaceae bacterium]